MMKITWTTNLGELVAFREGEAAEQLMDSLDKLGLVHHVETVQTP